MPPELTRTRRTILQAALKLGALATPSHVAEHTGLTKQAVGYQAAILRDLGYLEPAHSRYGALVPTSRTRELLGEGGYPLLGDIAAGLPGVADGGVQAYVTRLDEVIDMREGDFLLRVRGDSMIGIGIYPQDLVVVRPCEELMSGEIGVVLIPGEGTATLKRVHVRGQTCTLESENPLYPVMSFPAEQVRIQGQLVAHIGQAVFKRRT